MTNEQAPALKNEPMESLPILCPDGRDNQKWHVYQYGAQNICAICRIIADDQK